MRLAEGVTEQHAGRAPLRHYVATSGGYRQKFFLSFPTVDWQTKSRLRNKRIAGDGLERGAGTVGIPLIVAGDDPYFAVPFQANLGRAKYVTRGMKGNGYAVVDNFFAVRQCLKRDFAETRP